MFSRMSQIQPARGTRLPLKPRVVTAGVPMRRPEVTNGERGSFGTEFLFTVMNARPRGGVGVFAGDVLLDQESRNRWFWVPPETTSKPRSRKTWAMLWAFFRTCCWS